MIIPAGKPSINVAPEDLRLITRVAWMYYTQDYTQQAIADKLDLPRVKINRLVSKAKDLGLVDIRIVQPEGMFVEIEHALTERFGLKDAIVILDVPEGEPLQRTLAKAASNWMQRMLTPESVVGISIGRTMSYLAETTEPSQTGATFIEVMGASDAGASGLSSYDVIGQIARKTGGQPKLLDVPTFVSHKSVKKLLLGEPQIKERFETARNSDILITSVGVLDQDALLYRLGILSDESLKVLKSRGSVGDLLGHFIDAEGQPVENDLEGRLMAIDLKDLKNIPYRVLVAGGENKTEAILATLKGKYCNVLITDLTCAKNLINISQQGD